MDLAKKSSEENFHIPSFFPSFSAAYLDPGYKLEVAV